MPQFEPLFAQQEANMRARSLPRQTQNSEQGFLRRNWKFLVSFGVAAAVIAALFLAPTAVISPAYPLIQFLMDKAALLMAKLPAFLQLPVGPTVTAFIGLTAGIATRMTLGVASFLSKCCTSSSDTSPQTPVFADVDGAEVDAALSRGNSVHASADRAHNYDPLFGGSTSSRPSPRQHTVATEATLQAKM